MKYNIKHNLYKILLLGTLCIAVITPSAVANAKKAPTLSHKKITLQVGKKKQLKVKNTKSKVKWKSNKVKIATVTSKGKVTARKKGTAIITAKVAGKTLRCAVNVKAKPNTSNSNKVTEVPTSETPTSETPTSETPTSVNPAIETPTIETPTTEGKKIPDVMDPDTKDNGWTDFY